MKRTEIKYSIIILIFPLLFSCNNGIVYNEKKVCESGVWNIEDQYTFRVNIQNIKSFFDIYLTFDLDKAFLTNNLWVFVQTESPSKNVLTDTMMYFITDENGRWYGTEKRKYVEYKLLYKSKIKFPEKGDYTFTLKNGMRKLDLPKLHSAGLLIKEVELQEDVQNKNSK